MKATTTESAAMQRALVAARRGPRGVNPQVGAVILSPHGAVLAQGWHRGVGTPHAEVDAMSRVDPRDLRGATAVVTLEPCNHTGHTGPCAQALIDAGITRVVYAINDPGAVSGGGADRLRAAGVEVISGVLADEASALVASWMRVHALGRPHVTVKWAQSLDGRAAASDGSSQWITGPEARADVHVRRATADAIVVGSGTLAADDPSLTARHPDGTLRDHQPRPVVIGRRGVPTNARVHAHPRPLVHLPTQDLREALETLRVEGVHSVFVEGGPTLASAFLGAHLVDEVLVYVAPVLLGSGPAGDRTAIGDAGVTSITDAVRLRVNASISLGDDLLWVAQPLFAPAPDQGRGRPEGEGDVHRSR